MCLVYLISPGAVNTMILSLKSDFHDYYDGEFDREEKIPHHSVNRVAHRVTRESMLRYLSSHQDQLLYPNVVPHGLVEGFDSPVVVYTDAFAANGLGMELLESEKAKNLYPKHYSTLFLYNGGKSTKHVVVGTKQYLFSFQSRNNWKSTVGETTHTLLDSWEADYHPQFPLYTVSYVDLLQKKFAIKLNLAPKLSYLEETLGKKEVIQEIKGFYARIGSL